jgi:hypothetical protein
MRFYARTAFWGRRLAKVRDFRGASAVRSAYYLHRGKAVTMLHLLVCALFALLAGVPVQEQQKAAGK